MVKVLEFALVCITRARYFNMLYLQAAKSSECSPPQGLTTPLVYFQGSTANATGEFSAQNKLTG
jgi:hypothetical protein